MSNKTNENKKNGADVEVTETENNSYWSSMKTDLEKDPTVKCQILEKQVLSCRLLPTEKKIEEVKEVKEVKA